MLINGEKWACETCIKGHRATHCQHSDRKLVMIKKKGRPATQCRRCRELRVVRHLHVKCDCDNAGTTKKDKNKEATNTSIAPAAPKKKKRVGTFRPLAPRMDSSEIPIASPTFATNSSCCSVKKESPSPSPTISLSPLTIEPSTATKAGGCCGSKKKDTSSSSSPPAPASALAPSLPLSSLSSPLPSDSVPMPNIPPPTSCCGPPSKNQQGEVIRVVTCRCGDSCACIGCDAHPSRAMKEGRSDVYVGFDSSNNISKQRLSISAICATPNGKPTQPLDNPSSILADNGAVLCGCGCAKNFEDCSNCFQELCEAYFNN